MGQTKSTQMKVKTDVNLFSSAGPISLTFVPHMLPILRHASPKRTHVASTYHAICPIKGPYPVEFFKIFPGISPSTNSYVLVPS